MKKFIISARPKQILKNTVVFIPLIFTLEQWFQNETFDVLLNSILCFFTFSCCSIIGYQINDWIDREFDKKHPKKKFRPIANNEINLRQIYFFIIILFFMGLFFSVLVNSYVTIMYLTYLIFSFIYSSKLKNIILIDSISVIIFYIIRMIAGAYSITFEISIWLYILTFFSSLFLIFIKRTSETKEGGYRLKKIVNFYNNLSIKRIKLFLLFLNIFLYSIYTISEIVSEQRELTFMITILLFSFGIIRYYLITKGNNKGESPELIISKDNIIQISVFTYLIVIIFS